MTVLQPELRLARCFNMQAVTADTFGMAELQSRKASLVHICCASALKAKLEVDATHRPTAKAAVNPTRRKVSRKNEAMTHPFANPDPFVAGNGFGTSSRNEKNGFAGALFGFVAASP
jgi:hypothetical protein